MKFSPSINIKRDIELNFNYIATPNAKNVLNQIINSFITGIHSFNIIGSYGTGKSSFILAFENDLKNKSNILFKYSGQLNGFEDFEFVNIVGDYASIEDIIVDSIGSVREDKANFLDVLDLTYQKIKRQGKFLFLVIDEFGKVLEHAAKNNPEKELYTLQKLAEYVNDPDKNIVLLTTLHQNFGSYSKVLSKEQRSEWEKVRGRFKEVVFNEPVEQLLFLAADRLKEKSHNGSCGQYIQLYEKATECKFLSSLNLPVELAKSLAPLDVFAAYILTLAIQRYGQNERSLFTFLESKGGASVLEYKSNEHLTYNIACVYDYIIQNFYSYLSEVNSDSINWMALKVALERVEGNFGPEKLVGAINIVKTVGLMNIFASQSTKLNDDLLLFYSQNALGIEDAEMIIDKLKSLKIIRYAQYRSQYILYTGTDIDIEAELLEAGTKVPRVSNFIDKLNQFFDFNIIPAKSIHYRFGTPRYFEFILSEEPFNESPKGDIDGYVNLIFDNRYSLEDLISFSQKTDNAILFAYYKDSDKIIDQIFEIDKYQYLLDYVVIDQSDNVARLEIEKELLNQKNRLSKLVLDNLYSVSENITWVFNGDIIKIDNRTSFNKTLSFICEQVYSSVPIFRNELVNKFKPSGTISTARSLLLTRLLEKESMEDLDFPKDKFPPEKSIYLSLFKNTGIHCNIPGEGYLLGEPMDTSFCPLWNVCEEFLSSSVQKSKKLSDLIKILQSKPFKLKQGFIDIWIPSFLIIKRESYALYFEDKYIPYINKEVLDLIQRVPRDFSVKAFDVSGIRLDIFNKYRNAVNLTQESSVRGDSFIETIKPFLMFYKSLKDYAKKTKKLQHQTIQFRNILSKATDPQQTFFEDLPHALGFKETDLSSNEEYLRDFVQILQDSRYELSTCFNELLNRIENYLLDSLGIEVRTYEEYKPIIEERYKNIKQYLLSPKQKAFYSRVVSPLKERDSWICSISYGIFNKPLEKLIDEEEEILLEKLKHSFIELANFVELHAITDDKNADEVIKVTTTTNQNGLQESQIIIPYIEKEKCKQLEAALDALLSNDKMVDIYALVRVLNKRLENK